MGGQRSVGGLQGETTRGHRGRSEGFRWILHRRVLLLLLLLLVGVYWQGAWFLWLVGWDPTACLQAFHRRAGQDLSGETLIALQTCYLQGGGRGGRGEGEVECLIM